MKNYETTVNLHTVPAPFWRRCAAAFYDAFLLLALWMVAVTFDTVARDFLNLDRSWQALRAYLFLVGLLFFGWFWTHGGQTLGMRAWRLQLRANDGGPIGWPRASLRYAVAYLSWGVAMLGVLWCLIDRRGRAWHDIASGTELVVKRHDEESQRAVLSR